MIINGHRLPEALSQCLQDGTLRREIGSWRLKTDRDAYGYALETELGQVFTASSEIEMETARLSSEFVVGGAYGENTPELQGPGWVPDILDFQDIVCFAIAGDGSPFCLDYRNDKTEPSVIWWDDCYWRRIASDFEGFLHLLDMNS